MFHQHRLDITNHLRTTFNILLLNITTIQQQTTYRIIHRQSLQQITLHLDQTQLLQEILSHAQSPAILKRHEDVLTRWQKLRAASEARKYRLMNMQDQFRQIEDLYLKFAKKASSFNSWFENAKKI